MIILSVLLGAAVCLFGMWAFLRGQRSMLQIRSGGLPDGLFAAESLKKRQSQPDTPDIAGQLRAMFGDELNGEEGMEHERG